MLWILLILVVGFAAYKFRVPLLAKILGQEPGRIDRQINRKRR